MKYILLIYLLILTMSTALYAQNCGTPIYCPDKEYLYRVCDFTSGTVPYKCLRNPNGGSDIPAKVNLPLCLNFVSTGPDTALINTFAGTKIVYLKNNVNSDLVNSTYAWNC